MRGSHANASDLSVLKDTKSAERQTPPYCTGINITPRPPQGGFERPSNIMPGIMRSALSTLAHPLFYFLVAGARRGQANAHNLHYIKWPPALKNRALRCAMHLHAGNINLFPPARWSWSGGSSPRKNPRGLPSRLAKPATPGEKQTPVRGFVKRCCVCLPFEGSTVLGASRVNKRRPF